MLSFYYKVSRRNGQNMDENDLKIPQDVFYMGYYILLDVFYLLISLDPIIVGFISKQIVCFFAKMDCFIPEIDSFIPKIDCFIPEIDIFIPKIDCFIPEIGSFIPKIDCFYSLNSLFYSLNSLFYSLNG